MVVVVGRDCLTNGSVRSATVFAASSRARRGAVGELDGSEAGALGAREARAP